MYRYYPNVFLGEAVIDQVGIHSVIFMALLDILILTGINKSDILMRSKPYMAHLLNFTEMHPCYVQPASALGTGRQKAEFKNYFHSEIIMRQLTCNSLFRYRKSGFNISHLCMLVLKVQFAKSLQNFYKGMGYKETFLKDIKEKYHCLAAHGQSPFLLKREDMIKSLKNASASC